MKTDLETLRWFATGNPEVISAQSPKPITPDEVAAAQVEALLILAWSERIRSEVAA